MLTTHTFNTGELTLSYAEGPVNGPPLLLLHGLTGRWQDFDGIIPSLTTKWHVYACDFRGHGESGRAPAGSGYMLSDLVQDISVFIREALPVRAPVVLVGFSLGGLAAIPLAAASAERIRGVVAFEPSFMVRNTSITAYPVSQEIAWAHHATQTARSFEELVGMCHDVLPEADETVVLSMAERLFMTDPRVSDLHQIDQGLEGIDLDATMRQVRCPMLIVHGEQSHGSVVRDEDIAWAQEHNPQVRAVRVRGGGHGVHLEQPDAVARHTLAFLDELGATRRSSCSPCTRSIPAS